MTKVSPEEFAELLKGESILQRKEPGIFEVEFSLYREDANGNGFIKCDNILVQGEIILSGEYPFDITIAKNSRLGDLVLKNGTWTDIEITGQVELNSLNCADGTKVGKLTFSDTVNVGDITIEDTSYAEKLIFSGNCKVRDIHIKDRAGITDLMITDQSRVGRFQINNEGKIDLFQIKDDSQSAGLNIGDEAILGSAIISDQGRIEGIDLTDKAKVKSIQGLMGASIRKININKDVTLTNLQLKDDVQIGDINIHSLVPVSYFGVLGSARVGQVMVSGKMDEVDIGDRCNTHTFHIYSNAQISACYITDHAKMNAFRLVQNAHLDKWYVDGDPEVDTILINNEVDEIFVDGGTVLNHFRVHEAIIQRLSFNGSQIKLKGEIYIHDSFIAALSFVNFTSTDLVQISGLKYLEAGRNHVELTNSSFQRLELIGNDFGRCGYLVFDNSNFRNGFIADTSFPKILLTRSSNLNGDVVFVENKQQKKLFYEQLKTVYKNQGNTSDTLYYLSKELDQNYKNLTWTLRFWQKEFWDKLTLGFHKYTTYFGTQWIRGFIVLAFGSMILYLCLVFSSSQPTANVGLLLTHYFEFLNPTINLLRKWDFLYDLEGIKPGETGKYIPWKLHAILLLSKVFIVTMIYQIVQAFRKFGKG